MSNYVQLQITNVRKSTHGFPFLLHDEYGAPLGARAPLSTGFMIELPYKAGVRIKRVSVERGSTVLSLPKVDPKIISPYFYDTGHTLLKLASRI